MFTEMDEDKGETYVQRIPKDGTLDCNQKETMLIDQLKTNKVLSDHKCWVEQICPLHRTFRIIQGEASTTLSKTVSYGQHS